MGDFTQRELAVLVMLMIGTLSGMAAGYVHGGLFEMFSALSAGMSVMVAALGVSAASAKIGASK